MSRNIHSNPRLYLGNQEINNFTQISYKSAGKKISTLSVTLSDPQMDGASLLGKDVTFYLNYGSTDTVPFFRGVVKQYTPSDKNLKLTVNDVLGYLTGMDSPPLNLTDHNNYDGFTLGQMLYDYISTVVNKNETKIGLDMLNDTVPPVTLTGYRGKNVTPLKIIQNKLPKKTTSLIDIKNNRLVVRDDGEKSNICFVEEQDIDSNGVKFSFNDGIEKLSYKKRPSPNFYSTSVGDTVMQYQHNSLPTGIHSGKFKGKFEYPDQAREEAFIQATLAEDKKEISITVNKGFYLEIGNVVQLSTPEHPELTGKHRIVSKTVSISNSKISCKLKLSKEAPEVSDFINNS